MIGLAAPSQGSLQVSTWKVRMANSATAPAHVIDRDQVWMPILGSFEFVVDDTTTTMESGQALVIPAGTTRSFIARRDAEALVAMQPGGQAQPAGSVTGCSSPGQLTRLQA